jgi:hypothetical protein
MPINPRASRIAAAMFMMASAARADGPASNEPASDDPANGSRAPMNPAIQNCGGPAHPCGAVNRTCRSVRVIVHNGLHMPYAALKTICKVGG